MLCTSQDHVYAVCAQMAPHHLAALGQRQILGARLMLCDADLEHGTVHLHTGRSVQVFAVLVRKMFYYCQTRGRARGEGGGGEGRARAPMGLIKRAQGAFRALAQS